MGAIVVVDLGFGDAGKGTIVDFLSRRPERPPVIIRFNGGGQAAHNVITPSGVHHTFSQFGSGTYVPGTMTFLSRFMLVDPLTLVNEAVHLTQTGCLNPYLYLIVDQAAKVVTPYHKAVNRAREIARGDGRHGSCGMGIGETMSLHESCPELTMYVDDLRNTDTTRRKLIALRDWCKDQHQILGTAYYEDHDTGTVYENTRRMTAVASRFRIADGETVLRDLARSNDLIFEAAQGVLIDEWYGFHPYTTWSTTTFKNAMTLLSEISYAQPTQRLGVLRSYMVRHGPGPFPTEDADLTALLPELHNGTGAWQGAFRAGNFDAVLARYAIEACGGVDALAITHLDRLNKIKDRLTVCNQYRSGDSGMLIENLEVAARPTLDGQEILGRYVMACTPVIKQKSDFTVNQHIGRISEVLGVKVSIMSYGPTALDKTVEPS